MGSSDQKYIVLVHDSDSEDERARNVKETAELFKNKNPATIFKKKAKFSEGLARKTYAIVLN